METLFSRCMSLHYIENATKACTRVSVCVQVYVCVSVIMHTMSAVHTKYSSAD